MVEESQRDASADALDALARAEVPVEPAGEPAQSPEVCGAPHDADTPVMPEGDTYDLAAPEDGALEPPVPAPPRRVDPARRRAVDQQIHRQNSAHLKRTATPLLLATGVILLALGGVVLARMAGDGGQTGWPNPQTGRLLALLAFPMGALLIVGAWYFHRDANQEN